MWAFLNNYGNTMGGITLWALVVTSLLIDRPGLVYLFFALLAVETVAYITGLVRGRRERAIEVRRLLNFISFKAAPEAPCSVCCTGTPEQNQHCACPCHGIRSQSIETERQRLLQSIPYPTDV